MENRPLISRASAFLPVAMSLVALGTVLLFLIRNGPAPQPDEGASAHLWQILMAAQIPVILFFAIRWIPEAPRRALPILALQIAAGVAAAAPVFMLGW
jgi:hypothetical protein